MPLIFFRDSVEFSINVILNLLKDRKFSLFLKERTMKLNIKIIITGILLIVVFLLMTVVISNDRYSKQSEQRFYDRFNQIPENPDPEDVIGLGLANLSTNEEKEIQEIIKKVFEGQYLYRFCYKNEKGMDELVENLYISEEYQQFKKEFKKEYEVWCGMSLKDVSSSLEKMRFSKIGKYENLDDRVVIVAGPKYGSVQSFLFKKINNQWKIEDEKCPVIKYFFDEHSAAKQLLEQKNNETDHIIKELDYSEELE